MDMQLKEKIEPIIGEIDKDESLSEQGCTSKVRKLSNSNGEFLLKSSYVERYRHWLKTEAQTLQNLLNEDIPVPTYFGFVEEETASHLIMSFEKGVTLTSALKNATTRAGKISLIKSFGHFLQKFHEMAPIKVLQHEMDWLEERLEKAQYYLSRGEGDGNQTLLDKLNANKPNPVRQTMIHGDCTTDNVLVVDGEVLLFIDVSGMTVGDPRYDESLAISDIIDEPEYLLAFYEGYSRYRTTEDEFHYFNDGLYEFF
ncbi:phosphotransferase family protein [Pseudoneobacillus sp. C159]